MPCLTYLPLIVLILLLSACAGSEDETKLENLVAVFNEDFEILDSSIWSVSHQSPDSGTNPPDSFSTDTINYTPSLFINESLASCQTSNNVETSQRDDRSVLRMYARTQSVNCPDSSQIRAYTGAELTNNVLYQYGRFQFTMKAASEPGVVTSVYFAGGISNLGLYIMSGNTSQANLVVGINNEDTEFNVRETIVIDLGYDAAGSFVEYEIFWQEDVLQWTINGDVVYASVTYPTEPMYLYLSTWVHSGSSDTGVPSGDFTVYAEVDNFRYDKLPD